MFQKFFNEPQASVSVCQKFLLEIGYCLYPYLPRECVRIDTPRIKVCVSCMAPKPKTPGDRPRGFMVVLQDSHKGTQTKQDAIDYLHEENIVQAVVALEPYGHQEGTHIHLFYRLKSPSHFKTQLKKWVLWYKGGRTQVDVMYGTMAQACRYLSQEDTRKNKLCDPDPYFFPSRNIKVSPEEFAESWMTSFLQDDWGKNFPVENFCNNFLQSIVPWHVVDQL